MLRVHPEKFPDMSIEVFEAPTEHKRVLIWLFIFASP
jgi:hypothetical protein